MPADVQELFSEVSCYSCYGFSLEELLTLAELKRILLALDPTADTDVNSLLAANPCLDCYSNGTLFDIVEMALLAAIYNTSSAVGSFLTRAGITDATQIAAVTQLYADAVAHGWWDLCDVIYPFVGGTALAHSQNLKSTDFTITWFGTVTHNANGITGDGTTGYGKTGYIPSLGPLWSLNSGHVSVYRRTTGAARTYFAVNDGVNLSGLNRGVAVNALTGRVNTMVAGSVAFTTPTSLALSMVSRQDAANLHGYDALVDTSAAVASTGVPTLEMYMLANNNSGVMSAPTAANLAFASAGAGCTFAQFELMRDDVHTFETTLGR